MATIRTTLSLQDQMTGVIRNMSGALEASINAFEELNRASNNAISTTSLEAARRSLGNLNVDIANMESNLAQSTTEQQRFNQAASDGEGAIQGIVGSVVALVGAYASLNGLSQAMDLADDMASSIARIDMMNDGLQTTEELQKRIFESAQRSLTPYQQTIDTVAALGNRAGDAFSNNAETILFAENLGKMFSIAKASQQESASATLQLTQALGAGVLRGEELNAVLEAAPNVVQAIADEMGVARGQIKELASDGLVTADIVKRAMLNATDEINANFAKMPTTFADVFTVFKNNALVAFDDVLARMTEISSSKGFTNFFNGLANSLNVVAMMASNVLNVMVNVATVISNNWWLIGPIIGTVTAAATAFGTAMIAVKTYTMAAAAATWVLNSALWASPITWVVASVIALIGALYLVVGAFNHFAGTSISATGIVMGAFAALGAYIYNIVAFFYNIFSSVAEFFWNVWQHPIYSVKMLFSNLAKTAISMAESMIGSFDSAATNLGNMFISGANMAIKALNWVIDAMNMIPGIDIGNVSEISARTSVTADLSKLNHQIDKWVGDTPIGYNGTSKMTMKSIPDAAVNAYKAVNNATGSNLDFSSSSLEDIMNSINSNIEDGNKDGKDTAKSAKKAADKVGIAVEDLKYMRDLSEREAINRYTTASIQVDMKNENYINNELDIDGVIDRFGERAEEVADALAIGGVVVV